MYLGLSDSLDFTVAGREKPGEVLGVLPQILPSNPSRINSTVIEIILFLEAPVLHGLIPLLPRIELLSRVCTLNWTCNERQIEFLCLHTWHLDFPAIFPFFVMLLSQQHSGPSQQHSGPSQQHSGPSQQHSGPSLFEPKSKN